jgi:hypothetical protein
MVEFPLEPALAKLLLAGAWGLCGGWGVCVRGGEWGGGGLEGGRWRDYEGTFGA